MNIHHQPTHILLDKKLGETPLEALERFRVEQIDLARQTLVAQQKTDQKLVTFWESVPMTYAGRLDPMAEGKLLILIGDECKHKEKYLGLDKEYEVEIVFGIETDTYDSLGMSHITEVNEVGKGARKQPAEFEIHLLGTRLHSYVGRFVQSYPPFSSKTVNGVQLHELARTDSLPEEMPTKEVEIYNIELIKTGTVSATDLLARITENIHLVKGDFRQYDMLAQWHQNLSNARIFSVATIRVRCSSGTYMRSLAHKIGQDIGTGACALSIKRTGILGL